MKNSNSIKKPESDKSKLRAIKLKNRKTNCRTIQNPSCRLFGITKNAGGSVQILICTVCGAIKPNTGAVRTSTG